MSLRMTAELAFPIVNRLMKHLQHNIHIMDEYGVIVASGDMSRLNQRDEGAVQVLSLKKEMIISEEDSALYSYTKSGVYLPIEIEDEIVGVIGITGNPDNLYELAEMLKLSVEVLLQQMYMNTQMQYQTTAVKAWVLELVNPYQFELDKLEALARFIQIDFQTERSVLLIKINELVRTHAETNYDSAWFQRVSELRDQILNTLKMLIDSRSILTFLEEGTIFLSVPFFGELSNEKRLADLLIKKLKELNLSVFIGIGKRNKGIEGCRESYFQAKQCINLLQKYPNHENVAHIEEWGIIRILDLIPQEHRAEFINKHLYAKQNMNKELEETLSVFLNSELHIKNAASKLHIHHNTLIYRLEKISEQLNLDPRKFNDAILLKIIQTLEQLEGN